MPGALLNVRYEYLSARRIDAETCSKWGYGLSDEKGGCQVATYCDNAGAPVAQKLRFADKTFAWLGDSKSVGLYGEHLWRDGGRRVVITEGEIDALSVSQAFENKWPVVSVPNGAQGAANAVKKSLEWLEKFDVVVFCFDNDLPGRQAASECANLLSPGKAHIAVLPLKDANDMLKAGRTGELVSALWEAKVYRPDGIISGRDVLSRIKERKPTPALALPWPGLQDKTLGLRIGELVTICAGSGVGKTEFTRAVAHHIRSSGHKLGYLALEESVERCAIGLVGIELGSPLHLVDAPQAEAGFDAAYGRVIGDDGVAFYEHFGSTDPEVLIAKIRYMNRALGCRYIILDHISIIVSGLEDGDERRIIDNLMTRLKKLTQESDLCLIIVSHLKSPERGPSHEEGGRTSLSHLRGSRSIGQLSNLVIGLERDQQDALNANVTRLRVLKNRYCGRVGVAGHLLYSEQTGRFMPCQAPEEGSPPQSTSSMF